MAGFPKLNTELEHKPNTLDYLKGPCIIHESYVHEALSRFHQGSLLAS